MSVLSVEQLAGQVPLLADLDAATLTLVAGCATLGHFAAGELLAREGAPADTFFAVREGRVALELVAPARAIVIETLGPGDVCGWSWLFARTAGSSTCAPSSPCACWRSMPPACAGRSSATMRSATR